MTHVEEPCKPTQMLAWCGHVSHGRHMAGPHEPTQTPGWRLLGMGVFKLASDGPTSIVGPGDVALCGVSDVDALIQEH